MAVTTITPTQMSLDTDTVISQGAGTAINTANTMEIAYPKQGKLIIIIDSDNAATEATFTAGVGVASGAGTLAWAVADTTCEMMVLSSDRFVKSDGNVEITWAGSSAGFVRAFYLP